MTKRPSRRLVPLLAVLLVLVVGGLAGGPRAARGVGHWLVAADTIAPSDAIVVLDGSTPARELGAADLYHRGVAPRIVVSNARPQTPQEIRSLAGMGTPQDGSVAVLTHVRVPASAIVRSERRIENTHEELATHFEYARAQGFRRVIIVSSPYHLRRVRVVWNARYQARLPALLYGTPYEPWDADRWWRSRHGLEWTLHELVGIAHFRLGSPIPTFGR
ncbi:MAG: YdcF family protein [Candidatus Rokubacteria bacterium]|nr:YdcF family protein [Candidatus Rokubacteria bacterium]